MASQISVAGPQVGPHWRRARLTSAGAISLITGGAALGWSLTSIVVLLLRVHGHGGTLSGNDGPLAGSDQFVYMDEIRQSGAHLLIREHFDLTTGHSVYLQPLYLLGGLLWRSGLSISVAFWSLKLAAALGLGMGIGVVVARCLAPGIERVAGALLALFYMSPLVPLLAWSGAVSGFDRFSLDLPAAETMPAWQLWGYPHAALAIGLLALAGMSAASLAEGRRSRRLVLGCAACAGFAAWMHPWQGAIFILVAVALVFRNRSRELVLALIGPVLAVVVPMTYLAILPHVDAGWHTFSQQNGASLVPAWMLLAALLPLALVAPFGLPVISGDAVRTVLVGWPLAALAVFLVSPQFRYHALQGISIPLAVLSVAGFRRLIAVRWLVIPIVFAAVIAGPAYEATTLRDSLATNISPYWFTRDERHALGFLAHVRTRGGVLSRYYLGMAVPAYTGRRTWMGHQNWTPSFARRRATADLALGSVVPATETLRFVRATGATFVLTDCGTPSTVSSALAALRSSIHHFGCATVFVLSRGSA